MTTAFSVRVLAASDANLFDAMLEMFGNAFGEADTYGAARPRPEYIAHLLGSDSFIALVALKDAEVVGGLAAYELRKFERERSEIYVYDLAVAAEHRRKGIATALIEALREVAAARGAYVMLIQTDHGDEAAIALYTKLGRREDVLHFDIPVK